MGDTPRHIDFDVAPLEDGNVEVVLGDTTVAVAPQVAIEVMAVGLIKAAALAMVVAAATETGAPVSNPNGADAPDKE